jgi:RNA polymerase sigma-70 factor (sigma-E family)
VESEFGEFVAARSAALFRTAVLLTGDRHAADDLVQSTLEKACRRWSRVRRAASPDAYVRRILVNLANDRWRRHGRAQELPLVDDRPDGADPYQQTDQRDQLVRALHTLPIGMRTVLVLRYFDDLSDADIADLMGVSAATVRSQAARGLARLRTAVLGDEGDAAGMSTGGAAA